MRNLDIRDTRDKLLAYLKSGLISGGDATARLLSEPSTEDQADAAGRASTSTSKKVAKNP
jgi:hypothetical protein